MALGATAAGGTVTTLSTVEAPQALLIVALTVKPAVTDVTPPEFEFMEAPPEKILYETVVPPVADAV